MQESKIEDTTINEQDNGIINKKNTITENSTLNYEKTNNNEFSDKKSCLMKHRL